MSTIKQQTKKKYDMRGFWPYFAKFANIKNPYVWFFTILGVAKPIFLALQPYIIVKVMDNFNNQSYDYAMNLIVVFIVLSIATNITATTAIDLSSKYFTVRLVKFNEYWISRLISHSNSFFQNRFGGSITSNYTSLHGGLENLWNMLIEQLPMFLFQFVSILVISILYDRVLGLLIGSYLFIFVIFALFLSTKRRRKRSAYRMARSEYTGRVADIITNIFTVKTESTNNIEVKLNQKDVSHKYKLAFESWHQGIWFGGLQFLLNSIFISFATVASFQAVKSGRVSSAIFVFVISYGLQTTSLIEKMGNIIRNVENGLDEIAPMYEIIKLEPEIKDPPHPEKSNISTGGISFNKLKFSYGDAASGTKKLFSNFNLDIKPGEKIGLVGPSGGGKTTITKLILRFMDVDGGEILIDGQNIANITQNDLRKNITYVPQEPLLFHRSLKENIAYGKPGATEAEIIEVAKKARAHEFITPLKSGYNTLVGERGTKLSGGQRQRVAIARAMLKPAPILILDEATSALDSESEKKIQEALWELMKNKTAIVVAHRLSTIKHMDRIIVIENGKIKEQGSHTELIKLKGSYANLWQHQSGGFV
ncbi:MAG TPA: ABC transporter ATP-binding protein [Candidatus Saccharibacteria bacterium]|nr:ABC transporter ATP-binding protein [Candidatus Saccharibacteria bacterium]